MSNWNLKMKQTNKQISPFIIATEWAHNQASVSKKKMCVGSICWKLQNHIKIFKLLNKKKNLPYSWVGKVNIVNISIKIPENFYRYYKMILKFIWKTRDLECQPTIINKDKIEGLTLYNFITS